MELFFCKKNMLQYEKQLWNFELIFCANRTTKTAELEHNSNKLVKKKNQTCCQQQNIQAYGHMQKDIK